MPRTKRYTTPRGRTALAMAPEMVNQAEKYGVRIVPTEVGQGQAYWQIVSVRHLPPEENRGRHNIYVDAQDESGQRSRDEALRIGWTWEGRQPQQVAEPKRLDKPDNEPAGNVDVNIGQHIELWIQGDGLPSDHVANLHTEHPDETGPGGEIWNSRGHHSFHVVFRRTRKAKEDGGDGGTVTPKPVQFRFEAWPTEFRTVTQRFGANPQDYAPFDLPGHEGMDIKATPGSKVFCVAPGRVKLVHLNPDKAVHNYGIHVRVEHADNYETIYAHLQSVAVQVGQEVRAGEVLGLADNTGNSRGDHLHLTLKHHGETFDGYPRNIVDPTPFLAPLQATAVGVAPGVPGIVQLRVADKLGLNCNAPTDSQSGAITPRVADPGLIADTGVGWVRVNFILSPFKSPTDPTWVNTYRQILNGLRGRGLKIYGLIHAQAVAGDPGNRFRDAPPPGPARDEWIESYAQNFRQIVQTFRDDVAVFESFNEPNNWHRVPGDPKQWEQAWIHPAWFAIMLQRVYDEVRDLNVTLVSGPLLSTEHGNDAAVYLPKVYKAGKDRFGWGQPGKPVPFDGVGFHPYVLGDSSKPDDEIPPRYRDYMEGVRREIRAAEGGVLKPIYLSEMGWQNAEERQPGCMAAGLRCALEDPTVALCCWYGMQDDGGEFYGLYRKEGLSPAQRKPVYDRFVALARDTRLVPAAGVRPAVAVSDARFGGEFDAVPDGTVLAPGRTFKKTWRLVNTGTTTWNGGYQFVWMEGQSLGAPPAVNVPYCPPGQLADISVEFAAPPEPGNYKSTWRLVDAQGNPFGDKVWTEIRVAAVPVPAEEALLAPAMAELPALPVPGVPPAGGPIVAVALGIIYNTYWLRVLAASSAADPQQALQAAASDALAQLKEWAQQGK